MNDIEKTLKTLKSLDYKSPIRSRYINKLTKEDLIFFNNKIKEGCFLPDIHLHHEDSHYHSFGLTILNYLYDEEEIAVWFDNCLKRYFNGLDEVEGKTIKPHKVHRKILGCRYPGADLGFNKLTDGKLFQKSVLNYKDQLPYPKELVDVYFKAINDREPLTDAITQTSEIFGKGSQHTFIRIIDTDILPIIGKEGFKDYIEDMVVSFKEKRKVNPDIPINHKDFSFFMTGNCEKFLLKTILKLKKVSDNWIKAYLEALLPEFIKAQKINRNRIYQLLEFDEAQIEEWEERYFKESSRWMVRNSYNKFGVNPDRLSEEERSALKKAIKTLIEPFKKTRILPSVKEIYKKIQTFDENLFRKFRNDKPVVRDLISDEIAELKNDYFKTRTECINNESDYWRYYFKSPNNRVWCSRLDFNLIHSEELKQELKVVFKHLILKNDSIEKYTFLLPRCAQLEELFDIHSFKDITDAKLRAFYHYLIFSQELAPPTVSLYNTAFIKVFDILIKEVPSLDISNEARNIRFHNRGAHSVKTEIIPKTVLKGINQHLDEVPENIQLIFKLFMTTGWRYKEVLGLKPEDFKKVEGYPDLVEVETTNTKTASARKKAGYTLHPCDFIPVSLYNQLKDYLEKTRDEREFYHIDTCFYIVKNGSVTTFPAINFNIAINKIIQKYQITDENGRLWHFSSRQTRKKVAITLIEEGVPLNVVQQKLTHQSPRTTQTYYTESEEIKLAQVNEDYFREYIEAHLNSEVREKLSETELKQLYLNYEESLRLENGICSRPLCSRLSESGCAGCSKICTGDIYLKEWQKLLESVRNVKVELEELYRKNGINPETYTGFKEYRNLVERENYLTEVVNEIERKTRK